MDQGGFAVGVAGDQDVGDAGAPVAVHADAVPFDGEAGGLEPEAVQGGRPTDAHDHLVDVKGVVGAVTVVAQAVSAVG